MSSTESAPDTLPMSDDDTPAPSDWFVDENGKPETIYGKILDNYEVMKTAKGALFLRRKTPFPPE